MAATDEQIVWRQLHENIHRRNLHPLDLARAIDQAMQDGLTMEQVADKLGKSLTWVQKVRTVATDLTDEARQELLKSPMGESVDIAYEVATTRPEEQAGIARKITQGNLTRDQVRELAKASKRDGDSHHSGRTGRKAKKKPFSLRWMHENGVIIEVTARKKTVSDEEVLAAAQAFVRSLTAPKKRRDAA